MESVDQARSMMGEVYCRCNCGKAGLVVTGPALCRIKCHCSICQVANRAPFADSTILVAQHVPLERVEHVQFETRKKPPALQRGFCRSCGCYVMAHSRLLPFLPLAFVPVARYPAGFPLPDPELHLYYESRVADVDDSLPKYIGGLASYRAVLRLILKARFKRRAQA